MRYIYIYKFVEVQSSEVRPSFASTLLTTHWLEDNPCFHRKIIDISGEKTKNCPCFPLSNALCVWEERRNSRVLAEKKRVQIGEHIESCDLLFKKKWDG